MLNELPHFWYYGVAIMCENTNNKRHNHTQFCAKENLFHAKKDFCKFQSKML